MLMLAPLLAWSGTGCVSSEPKAIYPPPETLKLASTQREDFVQAFLEGRWCQAENLLASSSEKYLYQDDVCAAAYNYFLFWKLKGYIGIEAPALLERAHELRQLGTPCTELDKTLPLHPEEAPQAVPEKDQTYRALLKGRDFQGIYGALQKEENPLFASVYGRKAGRLAMEEGLTAWATRLLETVRRWDAERGWIVFVLEDWRLLSELATDPAEKRRIAERTALLRKLIRPCDR
jgi:hypothetical protein